MLNLIKKNPVSSTTSSTYGFQRGSQSSSKRNRVVHIEIKFNYLSL